MLVYLIRVLIVPKLIGSSLVRLWGVQGLKGYKQGSEKCTSYEWAEPEIGY